jgi:hypothetical protein
MSIGADFHFILLGPPDTDIPVVQKRAAGENLHGH